MASTVRLNDGATKMKRADQRASITVLVLGDGKLLLLLLLFRVSSGLIINW